MLLLGYFMPVEYDTYKGHELIVLKRSEMDRYPFKFGKSKARLIVENIEAIKQFAAKPDESETESTVKNDTK